MALAFGFRRHFELKKVFLNDVKNLYTKVVPLTVISSRTQKIFDDQLKNLEECKDDSMKFKYGYNVIKGILSDKEISFNSSFVSKKIEELIEYNLEGGRHKRIKVFLNAYEGLAPAEKLSGKYLLQAYSMAWIHQLIMCVGLIIDDILDDSELRRNKITWPKKVGRAASNDPFLLCCATYIILRNLFEKEPYFLSCLNVIFETNWWFSGSLCLDAYSLNIMKRDASLRNWDVHRGLLTSQIGTTAFQAPLFTAFHMAGYDFEYMKTDLMEICALLGYISKDRNDYIDRYSKSYRKTPDEDIRIGKTTWFLLTALDQCNAEQMKIIQQNYGTDDPECANAVVNVYEQLKLEDQFYEHEKQLIEFTGKRVQKIPDEKIRQIFSDCVHTSKNWYND